jgi:hypothetical protein
MSTQVQNTGFLGSLFDFTFANFITARLIRVLYALGLLLAALMALVMIGSGFTQGFTTGLLFLILGPLVFLVTAMYLRVVLEVLIVIFRIAENVETIANRSPGSGL